MEIKYKWVVFVLLTVLTVNAMAADSDFAYNEEGNQFGYGWSVLPGSITNYMGWDTDVVIPATIGGKPVKAIGEGAFRGAGLTSVTIPAGVEIIGKNAFRDNKLTTVTIPGTVKTIERGAFADNQLIEVVISEGVTNIGLQTLETNIGAFQNNKLTEVIIPEGVVAIGEDTFKGNQLVSITLPASIRNLGDNSFSTGNGIGGNPTTVILPDYMGGTPRSLRVSLGSNIFYNYIANNMEAGTYNSNMRCDENTEGGFIFSITQYGVVLHSWNGRENRLRIPSELGGVAVKAIGYGYIDTRDYGRVFRGTFYAKYLDNILIPDGITFIGEGAFNTNRFSQLILPDTIVYIGTAAFSNNGLSKSVITLPKSLKYLANAFTLADGFTFVIGANIETADDDRFGIFYRQNGKKAGRYIYNDRRWSYREE